MSAIARPDLLRDTLQSRAGEPSTVLLLGQRSVDATKVEGYDPSWTVRESGLDDMFSRREAGIATGSQHLVVSLEPLEELMFPWLALQELSRYLLPGGELLVALGSDVGSRRHLEGWARWADLVVVAVDDLAVGTALFLLAKPVTRGLRRRVGRVRQDALRGLSRVHAARRGGATQGGPPVPVSPERMAEQTPPSTLEAPQATATDYDAGYTSAPPPAIYQHRLEVLRRLVADGFVTLGAGSYGTPEVYRYEGDESRLRVGAWTSLADDSRIMVGGNHRTDRASTYPFRGRFGIEGAYRDGYPSNKGDVVIGNDVWIGRGALILSGAQIGDGAVVGAGAVVSGTVRPYAVVVGNPAREVRRRFDDETVARLLRIRWWDWPQEELIEHISLLNDEPVDALLSYGEARPKPTP